MFKRNWAGAKQVRLPRGVYQYFRPDESATAQADLLIAAVERDRRRAPPVIDVEVDRWQVPRADRDGRAGVGARVRTRLGVEPIVYTSPDFWRDEVGGAESSSQPLWVAHYTKECPRIPAPWTTWTFWQHSKTGQVPGISGPVDFDVFSGNFDALRIDR